MHPSINLLQFNEEKYFLEITTGSVFGTFLFIAYELYYNNFTTPLGPSINNFVPTPMLLLVESEYYPFMDEARNVGMNWLLIGTVS